MFNLHSNDLLEHLMLSNSTTKDENPKVAKYSQLLEASPAISPSLAKVEPLQDESKPSFDEAKVPEVELKPPFSSLRYEFLGQKSTYPVIVCASLNATQINSFLGVLREHRKAIGYTLDDLNGVHPSLFMHRILMEDDHKPSIEHPRRSNPSMQEVVKKRDFEVV